MQGSSGWTLTEQEDPVGGICEHPCGFGTGPGLHYPGREGGLPNLQVKATDSERSHQPTAVTRTWPGMWHQATSAQMPIAPDPHVLSGQPGPELE